MNLNILILFYLSNINNNGLCSYSVIFDDPGNIGSGKSTMLKHLKTNLSLSNDECKIVFVDEPVSSWENIKDSDGKNMIEKFYENQMKYAFAF